MGKNASLNTIATPNRVRLKSLGARHAESTRPTRRLRGEADSVTAKVRQLGSVRCRARRLRAQQHTLEPWLHNSKLHHLITHAACGGDAETVPRQRVATELAPRAFSAVGNRGGRRDGRLEGRTMVNVTRAGQILGARLGFRNERLGLAGLLSESNRQRRGAGLFDLVRARPGRNSACVE